MENALLKEASEVGVGGLAPRKRPQTNDRKYADQIALERGMVRKVYSDITSKTRNPQKEGVRAIQLMVYTC